MFANVTGEQQSTMERLDKNDKNSLPLYSKLLNIKIN